MISFFVFFVHKLPNKWLQFVGLGLHSLLMLKSLLGKGRARFINKKKLLNNNNNNILLL